MNQIHNMDEIDNGLKDSLQKEIEETTKATRAAMDMIMNRVPWQQSSCASSRLIKYKPSTGAIQSGAKVRMVRMVDTAVDPLEPPKFKHKKVPSSCCSQPVPVIHSPPRPMAAKDDKSWRIPPCASNWKNPKGYTIPLDKRVEVLGDERGRLDDDEDVRINVDFARLSEALYVAEHKAREAVEMRSKVQREMAVKVEAKKEQALRELAAKARSEGLQPKKRRPQVMDGAATVKRSKVMSNRDRDVSEKVALGIASVGAKRNDIAMYDQRLFNQEKGIDSGFACDDQYNLYDKELFTAKSTFLSGQYHSKKVVDIDSDMYAGLPDGQVEYKRIKPNKGFTGTAEKSQGVDADLFGLDQWFAQVKDNLGSAN